jgi:hypothetical protein
VIRRGPGRGAALLAAALCLAGPAAWTHGATGPAPLDELVRRVRTTASRGEAPIIVFDIDGTLVDPAPRTWHIFRDVGHEQRHRFPWLPERVAAMDPARFPWPYAPDSALARAAITDTAASRALLTAWRERFFASDYLDDDVPLAGAVAFVDSLHRSGATIVYLTGRPAPTMLQGTVRSLQRCGFPVGLPRTQLVLKPRADLRDGDYKAPVFQEIARAGEVVATFENEPGNINAMRRALPSARAFYVHTNYARFVPIEAGIDTVSTYVQPR